MQGMGRAAGGRQWLARTTLPDMSLLRCRQCASVAAHLDAGPVTVLRRQRKPSLWEDRRDRETFLQELAAKYQVKQPEDWRSVRRKDIASAKHGHAFLSHYGGSFYRALVDLNANAGLPEVMCVRSVPKEYWASRKNRREFLEVVAKKLGVTKAEEWRRVTARDIIDMGGHGFFKRYPSLLAALQDSLPAEQRTALAKRPKPNGHWDLQANRRAFLEEIAAELKLETAEDWQTVDRRTIEEMGGRGLLTRFKYSILAMLQDAFPEKGMDHFSCRKKLPHGFWGGLDAAGKREIVEKVAAELQVERAEDWAQVSIAQVRAVPGGHGLLRMYNDSLFHLLQDVYGKDDDWHVFKCRPSTPSAFWQDADNVRAFLDNTRKVLQVRERAEWTRITWAQLRQVPGGSSFLGCDLSLRDALVLAYPEDEWGSVDFDVPGKKKATQREVRLRMADLFPGAEIHEDYMHEKLQQSSRGGRLELDIYLPQLGLAVEYNGEQHYDELPFFGPLELTQLRDREKQELCDAHGIRLVTVPFWWDRQLDSLAATIHDKYPGLVHEYLAQQAEQQ